MRKIAVILAALLVGVPSLFAQSPYNYTGRYYVSVQGGMLATVSDNVFSYFDHGLGKEIFKGQGSFAVGYDFSQVLGVRVSVGYGFNAGASNVYETYPSGHHWPFTFHAVSGFADAVLNLAGLADSGSPFSPKLYGGLGCGYTFGFTYPAHPFQNPHDPNFMIAFRAGAIAEYDFVSGFGIIADLGLEAYDDWYNGIRPTDRDHLWHAKGYAGFPFDLVPKISLGVIYHFK